MIVSRIYTTEMCDPINHWDKIKKSILDGIPVVAYSKAPIPDDIINLNKTNFSISYTITGWGGTWLESNVLDPEVMINEFNKASVILKNRVLLRIDPIIPTKEGIDKAIHVLKGIMYPIRVITSVLQIYKDQIDIIKKLGVDESLYSVVSGRARFVRREVANRVISLMHVARPNINIQMCGMPYKVEGSIHTGCIDDALLKAMGINEYIRIQPGVQRPGCKCVISKKQLISGPCEHTCAYCYAHKENLRLINF